MTNTVGQPCEHCHVAVTKSNQASHEGSCFCGEDHPSCQHVAANRRR